MTFKRTTLTLALAAALLLPFQVALATPAEAATPSGVGTYENTSAAVTYTGTWTTSTSSNDSGGSYASTGSQVGTASFTFSGTSVKWVSRKTGSSGIADVYIDNTKVASVDRYSPNGLYQQTVFSTSSLSNATHTITIKATGTKNPAASGSLTIVDAFVVPDTAIVKNVTATAKGGTSVGLTWTGISGSTGYNVYRGTSSSSLSKVNGSAITSASYTDSGLQSSTPYFFAVTSISSSGESARSSTVTVTTAGGAGVYENSDPALSWSGTWTTASSTNDSGGSYAQSSSPSATVSFTFSGTSVQWLSRKTAASGINDVYIDGTKVASIDRYSANGQYQQPVFSTSALSNAVHTITVKATGTQNANATGSLTIVDAFRVPRAAAPPAPTGIAVSSSDMGVKLTWPTLSDPDLTNIKLYRSTSATAAFELITTLPSSATSYMHANVAGPSTYRYYARVVDYMGRSSDTSASASTSIADISRPDYLGASDCPAATKTVSTASTLTSALAAATSGDVIVLQPGTYTGRFSLSVTATSAKPVWVCGPRSAVLNGIGITGGDTLHISDSSNVIATGFSVTNSLKGIAVTGSDHITVSDTHVYTTGEEGIHLYALTHDSVVAGNVVNDTGNVTVDYGEGIYIGSYFGNWCTYTDCKPDASNNNLIARNTISDTAVEAIDAKEGALNGQIIGNTIDGKTSTGTDRSIVIRSNGWLIADNKITVNRTTSFTGILVTQPATEGYGVGNVIARNSVELHGGQYAVRVIKSGNTTACNNVLTGTAVAMTNVTCQR